MRIFIILCLSLLLMSNLCLAAVPNDLNNVLQQYKELNLLFEVNISHNDFVPKYQQLYINTRNIEEKNPEYKDQVDPLVDILKDIDAIWNDFIYNDYNYIYSNQAIAKKYPLMFKSSSKIFTDKDVDYITAPDAIIYLGKIKLSEQLKSIEAKYN